MKKLSALFMALLICLLSASCGEKDKENGDKQNGGFTVGHDPSVSDPVWD